MCVCVCVCVSYLARFIAVVSIMFICLVCDSSIVATCPSSPAAGFAFCLYVIRFVLFLLFVVVLSGEPERNQG